MKDDQVRPGVLRPPSCMGRPLCAAAVLLASSLAAAAGERPPAESAETAPPKKIVLIAGPKSHGTVGNGIHDYPWSVKLLKVMLDNSNVAERVQVEYHLDGWPRDPATLDGADTIMIVSDGRDGDLYEEAPHLRTEAQRAAIARQVARGCGFLTFHFSTFAPQQYAEDVLDWSGGYFQWETDGERKWFSAIQTLEAEVRPASPEHPVCRGVAPFTMHEEFYYNIRFRPGDESLTPLWTVAALPGRDPDGRVVAWARERADGGRGFGTTCGHFYDNWKHEDFRRLILNALVWTAGLEVPEEGVAARFYTHEEITAALDGVEGAAPARLDDRPIRALILTGAQHPAHQWQDTTPAIREALRRDPRLQVDVSEDVEDLAGDGIGRYDLLVLNYCNWMKPGLSDAAKAGFLKYLNDGGGLCIVHFANGAFHFSLPEAEDSDWPEYRRICRRVWDHTPGLSGHDPHGRFVVEIADEAHPITRGMRPFDTVDELYYRQQGEEPIHVLATARSRDTGRHEPMAFVYDYGPARVFQTVLGHDAAAIRTDGTSELLRRAATWVARRDQLPRSLVRPGDAEPAGGASAADAPDGLNPCAAAPGRFGRGLDARAGGAFVAGRSEYRQPPLTVECWAKLDGKAGFNILVANEPKASPTHWEMFSFAGTGHFTVYMPGMEPDHVRSDVDICDGRWHALAMVFEPQRVRLYVDGRQVADQPVRFRGGEAVPGDLAFGALSERQLGCDGVIDEVRISKGVREITAVPEGPFPIDGAVLGLWRFDEPEGGTFRDESPLENPARCEPAAGRMSQRGDAAPPEADRHFDERAVGFHWTEQDGVDNRWNRMQVGTFLASSLPLPEQPPVRKGLSIRVGDAQEGTVCFDTGLVALRAGWTGGFLRFDPARFGLIRPPEVDGDLVFASRQTPGWEGPLRYRGLFLHGPRAVLSYSVAGADVLESPWVESRAGETLFTRTLEVGASAEALTMNVLAAPGAGFRTTIDGVRAAGVEHAGRATAVALLGDVPGSLDVEEGEEGAAVVLALPPGAGVRPFKLLVWSGRPDDLSRFAAAVRAADGPEDLRPLTAPGAPRWTEPIVTRGRLGADDGPFVLDTLALPFDNPYQALFFVSGHDFFRNGDMAVATVHGDVWRVSGVDETLERLEWKRFATGLFQPLGLKVVDDQVYVLGRDQITRLHDRAGDGEADFYECFSNAHVTSPGGHDYVACLETDSQGRFYFVHATQGLLRVSRDGRELSAVATGFRNPNGLGIGPDDTITVSPQEGEWTPASSIIEARAGGYYGYGGPRPDDDRPLGYDPPLCWLPRRLDNSSGGQVWVPAGRWGPLSGQLLHFSYGRCRMLLVLRDEVEGRAQGAAVELPLDFESGVMRGRFSPHDGQLYVSGLKGWVSAAVKDGCLQRVRFTGRPVDLPVALRTMANGLALTFSRPLDPSAAEDLGRYRIEQWNYRYSSEYGSPEFKASEPRQEGRDDVEILSATLLEDGRTVFLELADVRPVMQTALDYALRTADGASVRQTIYSTIHSARPEAMDPSRLTRRAPSRRLDEAAEADLRPGLLFRFEQAGRRDARTARLAALRVAKGEPATPFLEPGPFTATAEGYLHLPLRGDYAFRLEGAGRAALLVNGVPLLEGEGDLSEVLPARATLDKGHNRLELRYESPPDGAARLRLCWSSDEFDPEPVPPTVLRHDARDEELASASALRDGRDLLVEHNCLKCHALSRPAEEPASAADPRPGPARGAPDLSDAGARLDPDWMAAWLLDPRRLRHDATMPRMFEDDPEGRRAARDVAAWLATLGEAAPRSGGPGGDAEPLRRGERLYEDLGCISCHRLTPPEADDEFDRISLRFVAAKFPSGALESFLLEPHRRFPQTRMPDFRLDQDEAASLAAYLRSVSSGSAPSAGPPGDPRRGRELFDQHRCANCHAVDGRPPAERLALAAPVLRGCLATEEGTSGSAPRFALRPADAHALASFLGTDARARSLARPAAPEVSERLVTSLRCGACHPRDGRPAPLGLIIAEESDRGLPPEPLPDLTWAGEKLKASWTAPLFAGQLGEPARPWLKARMPAFPGRLAEAGPSGAPAAPIAEVLARGLAAEHGLGACDDPPVAVDPELAEAGHRLSLMHTGLDCRQCHGVGDELPLGDDNTQLAPGINFAQVPERLRYDYYRRFVLDPPRYDLGSRMPKLAADGATTRIRDVLDGNARRQFEAIWHYLQTLDGRD